MQASTDLQKLFKSNTKDYPNGVWSLPPSFQAGSDYTPADARDRAKYALIGESDRMTLKFVRVADGAARRAGHSTQILLWRRGCWPELAERAREFEAVAFVAAQ